ncbi:MAG TPA: hypothetical protein DHV16_05065 [Nitrospiraceae bacterium]|nr:MAG: hypothetical protein A2X55_04210 [Nitrospirae bacterium GWB2_47_37]HAK88575.1 hypothetical protein [Nitrospiraceae bacterium]HCL82164.1 hypothetical protein [Nitrospiraceae bacterium]HCZ11620.1 hypothetical protein [Nitrospiraceae bacterium]
MFVIILFSTANNVFSQVKIQKGQTVYVPAYSHIFRGDNAVEYNLAITLMIRNTDFKNAITVKAVEYYDDDGRLVKKMIDKPIKIGPMASISFFLKESDTSGGIGANFIVKWESDKAINVPIIEAVMVGIRLNQSVAFISTGQVIRE